MSCQSLCLSFLPFLCLSFLPVSWRTHHALLVRIICNVPIASLYAHIAETVVVLPLSDRLQGLDGIDFRLTLGGYIRAFQYNRAFQFRVRKGSRQCGTLIPPVVLWLRDPIALDWLLLAKCSSLQRLSIAWQYRLLAVLHTTGRGRPQLLPCDQDARASLP